MLAEPPCDVLLCGAEPLSADELSALLDEVVELVETEVLEVFVELDELLEDELFELEELEELELSDELSDEADELSEKLSVPDVSEVTFPEQPVHSSTAARINAADLVINFFIICSFDRTKMLSIL